MEALEALLTRRSIRHYDSRPVEEEKLRGVLEAARKAPSWRNSQCWRFIIVREPAVKAGLSQALLETNRARPSFLEAPVIIVACAQMERAGYISGEPRTDKGDWFMFDVALAMENLLLAAHDYGLGTVIIGLFDTKVVTDLLDVPPDYRVVTMTPLGYPSGEPVPTSRKELSELVYEGKFGNPVAWS